MATYSFGSFPDFNAIIEIQGRVPLTQLTDRESAAIFALLGSETGLTMGDVTFWQKDNLHTLRLSRQAENVMVEVVEWYWEEE
jgi:hypothetical protein